jgi:hypothetical protein
VCGHDRAPGIPVASDAGGPSFDAGASCNDDGDCTQGTNGRCNNTGGWGLRTCTYDECFTDGDCGAGSACSCGKTVSGGRSDPNTCVKGNCLVDADCGGRFCSPTIDTSPCRAAPGGFYCHTAQDTCIDDSDCATSNGPQQCNFDPAQGHWLCVPITVCSG